MEEQRRDAALKIGLVQMNCVEGDLKANLAQVCDTVARYRGNVDLLVFPELTLTGYSVGERVNALALRLTDPAFQALVQSARGVAIAVGFVEETASFKHFNSLAFIQHRKLLYVHRKIYLPNYGIFEERKYFAPGARYRCVDLEELRVGPFVCGDAWNPALVHLAALDEALVFVFSACSPAGGMGTELSSREGWRRSNRFYATMYGTYVLFANRVGCERDLTFWGGSEIVDPFGNTVASAEGDEETVVVGEVDLALVRRARSRLHTVRDEDPSFIQRRMTAIIHNMDYL